MTTLRLQTNLRCGVCVGKITPILDAVPGIQHWSADVSTPDKVLTVQGEQVTRDQIDALLHQVGYQVLGELPNSTVEPVEQLGDEPKSTFFPLILILAYLLLGVALFEVSTGAFDATRAMRHFMAGFFLVFSFFKLLDVRAFATSYESYDIVTHRWPVYGWIYPFIELTLGAAYLTNAWPMLTNSVTLLVMGVSTVGVVRALLARRRIRCACLGTVFNLPMTFVTLIEDVLMVGMAAVMLIGMH